MLPLLLLLLLPFAQGATTLSDFIVTSSGIPIVLNPQLGELFSTPYASFFATGTWFGRFHVASGYIFGLEDYRFNMSMGETVEDFQAPTAALVHGRLLCGATVGGSDIACAHHATSSDQLFGDFSIPTSQMVATLPHALSSATPLRLLAYEREAFLFASGGVARISLPANGSIVATDLALPCLAGLHGSFEDAALSRDGIVAALYGISTSNLTVCAFNVSSPLTSCHCASDSGTFSLVTPQITAMERRAFFIVAGHLPAGRFKVTWSAGALTVGEHWETLTFGDTGGYNLQASNGIGDRIYLSYGASHLRGTTSSSSEAEFSLISPAPTTPLSLLVSHDGLRVHYLYHTTNALVATWTRAATAAITEIEFPPQTSPAWPSREMRFNFSLDDSAEAMTECFARFFPRTSSAIDVPFDRPLSCADGWNNVIIPLDALFVDGHYDVQLWAVRIILQDAPALIGVYLDTVAEMPTTMEMMAGGEDVGGIMYYANGSMWQMNVTFAEAGTVRLYANEEMLLELSAEGLETSMLILGEMDETLYLNGYLEFEDVAGNTVTSPLVDFAMGPPPAMSGPDGDPSGDTGGEGGDVSGDTGGESGEGTGGDGDTGGESGEGTGGDGDTGGESGEGTGVVSGETMTVSGTLGSTTIVLLGVGAGLVATTLAAVACIGGASAAPGV